MRKKVSAMNGAKIINQMFRNATNTSGGIVGIANTIQLIPIYLGEGGLKNIVIMQRGLNHAVSYVHFSNSPLQDRLITVLILLYIIIDKPPCKTYF